MAINFGDTIMEGSIEPEVRVQQPVMDNSAAIAESANTMFAEALGPVANQVGRIAGSIFMQSQQNADSSLLVRYENELLDLADAVDQGMSRSEAMLRARNLRRGYLSDAPHLQDDFDTIWSDFAGSNGLGHVVVSGTVEQQARDARARQAIELGYTPEEYELMQARSRHLESVTQELGIIQGQGDIVTTSMRNRGISALSGVADSAFPAAQAQINRAMAAIQANPDQRAQIAAETIQNIQNDVATLSAAAMGADASYIVDPINSLLTTFQAWSNNEIETSTLEAQINYTRAQYSAMFETSPDLGPTIATSRLLNELGLADTNLGTEIFTPEFLRSVRDAAQGNPINAFTSSEGSDILRQYVTEAAALNLSDPGKEELARTFAAIIDGTYVHERSANGALDYRNIVDTLGSAEAREFFRANDGVPSQYNQQFTDIIRTNYESALVPAITEYWQSVPVTDPSQIGGYDAATSAVSGISNIPMNELLDVVWNGSGVQFVPKPEWADNPRVQNIANEVNIGDSSIGVPLNNLIRAYANVNNVDPKEIWEEQFANRLFGLGEEDSISDRVNRTLDQTSPDRINLSDAQPDEFIISEQGFGQSSALADVTLPPLDPAGTSIEGINYESYLPSIRTSESGGNDAARNPASSAFGRYQFLTGTWNDLVARYPNTGLTYNGRGDPQQQEIAIRLFTAENARYLQRNGVSLTNGTLYAAHFLGAGDAARVLKATPSSLVSQYVSRDVVRANPFLRGMTVAQFSRWAERKGNNVTRVSSSFKDGEQTPSNRSAFFGGNREVDRVIPTQDDESQAPLSAVEQGFLNALSIAEGAGAGGTALRLYNDVIQRGRTEPITENDFSEEEQTALKNLVLSVSGDKTEGSIDYPDYRGSGVDHNILGGFRYRIENGVVYIEDTYDFNLDRSDGQDDNVFVQALAAVAAPRELAASIGRKRAPDTNGSGIPVIITLR